MLSHLTLCEPMDCSLPGSSVYGIFQARILEWVVISSPGDVPDSGIVPASLAATALAGEFFTTGPPGMPHNLVIVYQLSFSVLS